MFHQVLTHIPAPTCPFCGEELQVASYSPKDKPKKYYAACHNADTCEGMFEGPPSTVSAQDAVDKCKALMIDAAKKLLEQ